MLNSIQVPSEFFWRTKFFPTSWIAVFSQVWRRSIFKFCVYKLGEAARYRILRLPWWRSVGFERPSVQNGAKMGITREEIKNLLKEAIEPLERKLDNLNNGFQELKRLVDFVNGK